MEIDRELEVLKALSPIHREMHFAGAREYNAFRSELEGKDSPGRRANEMLARLKEEQRRKLLGPEYDRLQQERQALDREISSVQRQHDQKLRSAMRGFYNTPYSHHLRAQGLVKKTYRYRDEPGGDMQTAIEAYRPENWKTDVRAWDWRTRWERDGTISQYPMTRQWLKRVRGNGPINVVD